jgi:hypothetical protein
VKVVGLLLAVVGIAAILWVGGELHRQNCLRSGRVACSVLPWDKGKPKPAEPFDPLNVNP